MLNLAIDQILGTALLVIIILSVTDKRNMKIEASLVPVIIGLGLTSIHLRCLIRNRKNPAIICPQVLA